MGKAIVIDTINMTDAQKCEMFETSGSCGEGFSCTVVDGDTACT